MGWVKIDDHFTDHPKIVQAGPLAIAMQVAGLCYCNRYLTDGFITRSAVKKLLDLDDIECSGNVRANKNATWANIVESLVEVGMWRECEGGWIIHDYTEYQQPRKRVLREKQAAKDRMNKTRKPAKTTTQSCSENVRANNDRSSGEVRLPHSHSHSHKEATANAVESSAAPDDPPDAGHDPPTNSKTPPCPAERIVESYHELLPQLPRVAKLTDKRRMWLQARWRESGKHQSLEFWQRYFAHVGGSGFLLGGNDRGWQADFEWLVNQTNFYKTVEGKFHVAS